MLIRENVPLAPLTTLGVGGPARYFAAARNEADVLEAVEFAARAGCLCSCSEAEAIS
jgi:UDP-N-acetylmuramate dehydrogenase